MPGTKAGYLKARATMIEKWGEDGYREFYRRIGHKGGSAIAKTPRGFAADRERAVRAGSIGGKRSHKSGPMARNAEGKCIRADGKEWGSEKEN